MFETKNKKKNRKEQNKMLFAVVFTFDHKINEFYRTNTLSHLKIASICWNSLFYASVSEWAILRSSIVAYIFARHLTRTHKKNFFFFRSILFHTIKWCLMSPHKISNNKKIIHCWLRICLFILVQRISYCFFFFFSIVFVKFNVIICD